DVRMVMNTELDIRFRLPGMGPVAWATPPGYGITPVTTITADCRAIQVMSPRGGQAHVIAGIPDMRPGRPEGSGCPVTMLSWSPDGRWFALATAQDGVRRARAFAFDPLTHGVLELPLGDRVVPTAFSWSPDGLSLLVSADD